MAPRGIGHGDAGHNFLPNVSHRSSSLQVGFENLRGRGRGLLAISKPSSGPTPTPTGPSNRQEQCRSLCGVRCSGLGCGGEAAHGQRTAESECSYSVVFRKKLFNFFCYYVKGRERYVLPPARLYERRFRSAKTQKHMRRPARLACYSSEINRPPSEFRR